MNKIMRLSFANLRRHKKESILLGILIMLCMMLLGGAVSAEQNITKMFPELVERTGAWHSRIYTPDNEYDADTLRILQADERVADCGVYHYIASGSTRLPDENGREQLYMMSFFTEENERRYENFNPQTSFSESEIAAMQHPVYVPFCEKDRLHLKEGDSFSVINGSRRFTFTAAGFYESNNFTEPKFVLNDADYAVMRSLFEQYTEIGFTPNNEADTAAILENWLKECAEAGIDTDHYVATPYRNMENEFNLEIGYVLKIIEVMAVIILIAAAVMIGYSIVSDIKDQIVSIGVLEAIGYRSREIAGAYAAEYFLIALAGCIAGTLSGIFMQRILIAIAESMKGCQASHAVSGSVFVCVFIGLILIVSVIAYMKARSVRNYPPVLAFRKGIQNHHFGKSHFPLKNTKNNVHLRLALKGFADRAKQNIGLTFVMSITTFAVVLSFILYLFLGRGMNVIKAVAGQELADLEIATVTGIDKETFRAELESIPEIRKVLPTCQMSAYSADLVGYNAEVSLNIYRDYAETENIFPCEGRFPQHDNEAMITKQTASSFQLQCGQSITLEYHSIRRDYIVTGIVTSVVNPDTVYLTEDGMKQMAPMYQPDSFQIYCNQNTDVDLLRAELDRRFGKSAHSNAEHSDYEERVRARAEELMASMMEQNGAANISYAIRSGDTVISGNSSNIKIRSFLNMTELLNAVLGKLCTTVSVTTGMFMAISAAVVMMILAILMESEIRRQRRELGIMKGLGYTAKELMLQLAFRIMPAALAAVITGTVLSILGTKLLVSMIGNVPVNLPAIILLDCVILAFCFGSAWLGARKIRKISVYELMTE